MHKGSNHIPKSNCLVKLLFFSPVFCLIEVCGGKDFLNAHTYSIDGAMHRWELAMQRRHFCGSFYYQPLGRAPCAQAIIVNDKVTIEVIIVLN